MVLTQEEYQTIEDLAGCNYSPRDIAVYLGVNTKSFMEAWRNPDTPIRYHYDRGTLIAQAESDTKLLQAAKSGNLTANQIWNKNRQERQFENAKQQIIYGNS